MSLSIALTKGRLVKSSIKMLEKAGYGIEPLKDPGRALIFQDTKKDVRYFLAKPNDVITYVEHGAADIGITGRDTLLEGSKDYYELLDLNAGVCKFILASLPDRNPLEKIGHIKIGTKYPNVAAAYFHKMGLEAEFIRIDGSVEICPLLGLCDGIVDIMETGTTLKENGLIVYDEICRISARVIVNKAGFKLKRNEVLSFVNDMKKVRDENAE